MKLIKKEIKNDIETAYLLGKIPVFKSKVRKPEFDENTFFVWEPCTSSHAEVVPGFTKYLLDLGYKVSVLYSQVPNNNGLFSRFEKNENLILNKLSKKEIIKYFKHYGLGNSKGIMITTGGVEFDEEFGFSKDKKSNQKVLKVEHSSIVYDNIFKDEKTITLREMNYNGATTVEVNPHYFGEIKVTDKNPDITNFIVIGALRKNRRNTGMLIEAVENLHNLGIGNFKITVIGKGSLSHVSNNIRKYFEVKGRLDFEKMYIELEKADFFLPLLDVENKEHENTITTSTSGSFQLVYGFRKPIVMAEKFAKVNGFSENNSVLYKENSDLADAMKTAIELNVNNYKNLQKDLSDFADQFYNRSRENLRRLINE